MSLVQMPHQLELPDSLQTQLRDFRKRTWTIKMIEAVCGAAFGVLVAFLAMYVFDRLWETPVWARVTLFVAATVCCAAIPVAMHRWIWGHRHFAQLARLLSRTYPRVGDQLLGIIELVHSDSEQARSRRLCEAAIQQVAEDAKGRDLRGAVPNPRHRLWAGLVAVPTLAAIILLAIFPAAAYNAWARMLAPWRDTPRYTFAAVERLPDEIVVAHGEPISLTAKLMDKTASRPVKGSAQLGDQQPVVAPLNGNEYAFSLPPQIADNLLRVDIGDSWQRVLVRPMLRPELTSIVAEVTLPEYLGRPEVEKKDVRGGTITIVNGSRARFHATASRELASAKVDGQSRPTEGAAVSSPRIAVDGEGKVEFRWQDRHGLEAKEPFTLSIAGREDEAPTLVVEGLPQNRVVLDSEQLAFKVRARDDFGVKQVGIDWQGADEPTVKTPAKGERILAGGGQDKEELDVLGTFTASSLGIEPQPLAVRVFAEDYLPGRERIYSATFVMYILNAEQHAIWLTEQLSKWHRQSLEVRDRELQLHEVNKELRDLSPQQLDQPETRRRIESQAMAERGNGRRLSNLVMTGEELVKQATRNPEFGVGHLEKWAEMLQILKDISGNRMPSVADLLKQASQAQASVNQQPGNKAPMAGQNRDGGGGGKPSDPSDDKQKDKKPVPSIVDRESSQQPIDPDDTKKTEGKAPPSNPRLTLPVTTLAGKPSNKSCPAGEKMEEAVKQQQDLLAEFEKIAEELNRVLAELEGSTLVKRLKAASRVQYKIAGRIGDQLAQTFGLPASQVAEAPSRVLADLSEEEAKSSQTVSYIMDDMQAYYERRHFVKFKNVLDEMRKLDAIGSLRQLGDDIKKENGLSIAQAEFWSDTLDRWAEDLVDPACGCCKGCKSKGSLPPSIILEVLQILEGEVNLREDTRVAEQARPAIDAEVHKETASGLSETQSKLQDRVVKVIARIKELPDAEADFGKEIQLLGMVAVVMEDATGILARPDTGPQAIAAETEAIELLLQSKRINPKAGGGGGSSPGGGGGGTTEDSALPMLGSGVNDKEVREDRGISQSSGEAGTVLPEEFRAGLDEYFNRLERGSGGD